MTLHLQQAYGQATAIIQSPREAEYEVISRVTRELTRANESKETNPKALIEALYLNERLWSALISDVALEENGLPASLKSKLVYLYRFTRHQSDILRETRGDAGALIDINKAVLRGLRGEVAP